MHIEFTLHSSGFKEEGTGERMIKMDKDEDTHKLKTNQMGENESSKLN